MSIFDNGYDQLLKRAIELSGYDGGITNTLNTSVAPSTIISGPLNADLAQQAGVLYFGKTSFSDTTNGYRMGIAPDGTFQAIFGTTGSSWDWNVTTTNTLTIAGSITATSGTIGGFTIGATTITATNLTLTSGAVNTANIIVGTGATAGGLNSANASGDIVFWAGSTFANRATAPFRVTAGGAVVGTSVTLTGSTLNGNNLTIAKGISTHNLVNIGDEIIAHGLGVIPKQIRFTYAYTSGGFLNWGDAVYENSVLQSSLFYFNSSTTLGATVASAYAIQITGSSTLSSATVTVDATNITLNWTKTGSPTGTLSFTWEAIS